DRRHGNSRQAGQRSNALWTIVAPTRWAFRKLYAANAHVRNRDHVSPSSIAGGILTIQKQSMRWLQFARSGEPVERRLARAGLFDSVNLKNMIAKCAIVHGL